MDMMMYLKMLKCWCYVVLFYKYVATVL